MIIEIRFSPALVLTPARLPPNWKQLPAPKANAAVAGNWFKSGKSAILKLPSAIVPEDFNYLLNPQHTHFGRIVTGKPRLLRVHPRLGPLAMP